MSTINICVSVHIQEAKGQKNYSLIYMNCFKRLSPCLPAIHPSFFPFFLSLCFPSVLPFCDPHDRQLFLPCLKYEIAIFLCFDSCLLGIEIWWNIFKYYRGGQKFWKNKCIRGILFILCCQKSLILKGKDRGMFSKAERVELQRSSVMIDWYLH